MMQNDDTIPEGIPALSTRERTRDSTAVLPRLDSAPCVLLGEAEGRKILLELAEGRSVLGAGESASLRVAASGLAAEHVVFERSGAAVVATALAPVQHNGSSYDGSAASRVVLGSGDDLVAGGMRLRFVASEDSILASEPKKEAGVLWWAVAGWAGGYLAVLLLVTTGLIGPAAAVHEPPALMEAAAPGPLDSPEDWADDAAPDEGLPAEAASVGQEPSHPTRTNHIEIASPEEIQPGVERGVTPPVTAEGRAAPARAVAALPRREEPALRSRATAQTKRVGGGGRVVRKDDLVERMVAAWQGGAIEEVVALGEGSPEVEVHRLAMLARRFSRATERARRMQGIAAAPALEEALGIAEEIGRDAPPVQEVRRALAALHRSAARRAEARGDLEGAVHHCEQALAVRPGDSEARGMRRSLAERARPIYLDGYALQHLDPTAALRLFERASLLAMPDDPTGTRAAALAVKMRADVAGGSGADGL